jgi:uncharacterized membrane protein YbhN (UPF0104 family)
VLGTVVLERTVDVVVLVLLLACAAPFLPPVGWRTGALALGAVLLTGLAAVAVASRRYDVTESLIRLFARFPLLATGRVERIGVNFMRGLVSLRITRLGVAAVLVTSASWLALATSTWFLLLGTQIDEGFGAALLVLVATNLILILPSSPAALGAFEAAAVLALSAYGVDREQGLSFALVLHALNAFPYLPVGYAALVVHSRAMKRRSNQPVDA